MRANMDNIIAIKSVKVNRNDDTQVGVRDHRGDRFRVQEYKAAQALG
jgi:hypothetical protein